MLEKRSALRDAVCCMTSDESDASASTGSRSVVTHAETKSRSCWPPDLPAHRPPDGVAYAPSGSEQVAFALDVQ